MRTHPRLGLLAAALGTVTACAGQSSTASLGTDFGSFNGARLELVEDGGFAGLNTQRVVRHDDRSFSVVQRHICTATCPAPMDSASGQLSAAAADSLFTIVVAASPFSLSGDYGHTVNAADMVTYTLTVTLPSGTKTIRADDGTMPPPMRRIVEGVHGVISAARQ